MADQQHLSSWQDTPARQAIVDFVAYAAAGVPPEERVAVFDNDGTLWCEKPMPVQIGFMLERMAALAEQDPALREKQPYKAAVQKDYAWLGDAMIRHYKGDDSGIRLLMGAMVKAFSGVPVEEYAAGATDYLHGGSHPTLGRPFRDTGYGPMVELLRYLEAHGFTNYIASGGDRDFMRVITQRMYNVPPERVIGSSNALRYVADEDGNAVVYQAEPDVFDDGPIKPVRIWSRIGRRPIIAGGNSNGDIEMLEFAGGAQRALRLLLLHDDAEREFAYTDGAERSLEVAGQRGWSVVSMKGDWSNVFAEA